MRISIGVEGQEGMTWDEFVNVARAAEKFGIERLFRSDHYGTILNESKLDAHDAWASIAATAAVTERVRLGTMVSPATFRHPSVLARMVATIDHISHGRIEVGLGAGWNESEHAAYGFRFYDETIRFKRLAEQIEIIVGCWTQKVFHFAGVHYTLADCEALPKPVQRPHPPIILGGFGGPRAAALAARWAQEYNSVYATPKECGERRARLDDACRAIGRDPASLTFSVMARCFLGRDRSEVNMRLERVRELDRSFGSKDSVSPRGWESSLVGTVDEVASRITELKAAGVGHVVLHHLDFRDLGMIEIVGRELIPAVS